MCPAKYRQQPIARRMRKPGYGFREGTLLQATPREPADDANRSWGVSSRCRSILAHAWISPARCECIVRPLRESGEQHFTRADCSGGKASLSCLQGTADGWQNASGDQAGSLSEMSKHLPSRTCPWSATSHEPWCTARPPGNYSELADRQEIFIYNCM